MDDDVLRSMVAEGASLRATAAACGRSPSSVRQRVLALGLETPRMVSNRESTAARLRGERATERACPSHGITRFQVDRQGTYRCLACRAERVTARRRRIKEILVAEAGGRCALCGYDRCLRALGFHHVDPSSKAFSVAFRGVARSLARARAEAAKCVLLCANCHMEVEQGLTALPFDGDRG